MMRDYTSAEITALIERNRQLRAGLAAEMERTAKLFGITLPNAAATVPAPQPTTTGK